MKYSTMMMEVRRNQYISLANECTVGSGNIDSSLLHRLLPVWPVQQKLRPEWKVRCCALNMAQLDQLGETEYTLLSAIRAQQDTGASYAGNYDFECLQLVRPRALSRFLSTDSYVL